MENAKIKKLEPKEWLDRVIDNLDQLYILNNALRPSEITSTCISYAPDGFPSLHVGPQNVRLFAKILSLPIERFASAVNSEYIIGLYSSLLPASSTPAAWLAISTEPIR